MPRARRSQSRNEIIARAVVGNLEKMKIGIVLIALILSFQAAIACKCDGYGSVKKEFEQTELIVRGIVLSKEYVSYFSTLSKKQVELIIEKYQSDEQKLAWFSSKMVTKIELEVSKTYKGKGTSKVVIYTNKSGASCGYLDFEIGKEFIVYASEFGYVDTRYGDKENSGKWKRSESEFWTNHCRRTKYFNVSEHQQLSELKK